MATKAKITTPITSTETPLLPAAALTAPSFLDPAVIAAEAEATAAAIVTQRRAILAQLAQATHIPEADLVILFGLPA